MVKTLFSSVHSFLFFSVLSRGRGLWAGVRQTKYKSIDRVALCCERLVMKRVYRLVVTVKKVRGRCPVFKVGDKIVIDSPKIVPEKTDALCVHALGSMLSTIVALSHGINFRELGLAVEEGDVGHVQCLDPGPPYTLGGTVLFEIRREAMT